MSLLTSTDAAQQAQVENDLLKRLVEGLRVALAWEVQADDFSRKLSTLRFITQSFQRHLERLLALEEYDGYMAEVAATSPWLGRRVDSLRGEHGQLREAARRCLHGLEQIAPTDRAEFAGLCNDLDGLLHQVEEHTRKEVALVQEAFEQDGGGEG
jgi:hypothetical protein